MKILFEVREISRVKGGPTGQAQRITLDPCPVPADATEVDGHASRQLQVVIHNPDDFLPPTVEPGEILSISLRTYETDEAPSSKS